MSIGKCKVLQHFIYRNSIIREKCARNCVAAHIICKKINKSCKIFNFLEKTIDKSEIIEYTVSNDSKGAVGYGLTASFVLVNIIKIRIGENTYGKCSRDFRQYGL